MHTLLLIDGNALMHRAYHALPAFTTKNGVQTNAMYGFLSILNKAILDFNPYYLIVCFDTPVPTFRKKMFKEYQSHRPKMEDALSQQFPIVKEALDKAGIIHMEKEGYEADDIIGTISHKYHYNGDRVFILSGDRDILQLVNENVFVITPQLGFSKQIIYNPEEVEKRFGIKPNQIPDFKALMGDSSDNYKGAKGIGPKTASKLLVQYQTIDTLYSHLTEIEGALREKLEIGKENVLLSHKLATILTDVDIDLDLENTVFKGFDEKLKEYLIGYEMYSLTNRIFKIRGAIKKETKPEKKKENSDQIGLF